MVKNIDLNYKKYKVKDRKFGEFQAFFTKKLF